MEDGIKEIPLDLFCPPKSKITGLMLVVVDDKFISVTVQFTQLENNHKQWWRRWK